MFNYMNIKYLCSFFIISLMPLVFTSSVFSAELSGCGTSIEKDYESDFQADDFTLDNISIMNNGRMKLVPEKIDPNNIVVRFDHEVSVTFLYDGAGYVSDLGYILAKDAVDTNGNFKGWNNIPKDKRHPIFINIQDGGTGGGDGVFDSSYGKGSFPTNNESSLKNYDDGTKYKFVVNGDGQVTAVDMKKNLGTFPSGTELVFFLTADKRWDTNDTGGVFFTKTAWNTDTYSGNYTGKRILTEARSNTKTITITATDGTTTGGLSNNISFAANSSINRQNGSFITDGFKANQRIRVQGSTSNNGYYNIKTVTAGTLTLYEEFYRIFDLAISNEGQCPNPPNPISTYDCNTCDNFGCGFSNCLENWTFPFLTDCNECARYYSCGWLAGNTQTRMGLFGLTLSGTYCLKIIRDERYPHVMIGAPENKPDAWILGWEDLTGGGDTDFNDMAFWIHRQNGGTALLKSEEALETPGDADYFTSAVIEVYDYMPDGFCSGKTSIKYYLSINDGLDWVEVTDWDIVKEITVDASNNITMGATVENWVNGSGTPRYTYRSARIDFIALGYSGNKLLWKSLLTSDDDTCSPEIINVELNASVAVHSSFSRAAPISKVNLLYSGNYETPAVHWEDKSTLRGHLLAEMIYAPADPSETFSCYNEDDSPIIPTPNYCPYIWDAGEQLNFKSPDEGAIGDEKRTIYFPDIQTFIVIEELLKTANGTELKGDGEQLVFEGKLAHFPISHSTLQITDTVETFRDKRTNSLEGSDGGIGTINRYTGDFRIEFKTPPGEDVPIKASYTYYTQSSTLKEFITTNVDNEMLALDDTFINEKGYTYDLNKDGEYSEADGDWLVKWMRGYKKELEADGTHVKKEWLLGAIDHSVPALLTPPPRAPFWYFSDEITDDEKHKYDTFTEANNYKEPTSIDEEEDEGHEARPTVIFVGSRSGMLHAFDAGTFRWGDNPATTTVEEYRGYFAKQGDVYDFGTGEELWSFIPTNLIPRLKNNFLNGDDQAYMDASPAIADIYTGTEWKSVVLSAQGNGGDTVFCLDVTDPLNPKFMWEFSDPDLYRSISSPSVAAIGRVLGEDGLSKWAAFFVSGKTYDLTLYPSVYVIDIATGNLITRVFLDVEESGKGGTPSGQPALIDSDDNGFIDRAYIGTDKGYMYKINIPDIADVTTTPTITHCVINSTTITINGITTASKPIYGTPALMNKTKPRIGTDGEVEYDYDIKIFFGTGDSPYFDESINTANTKYYFLAYSDKDDKDECTVISQPEWVIELPAGERVWASAFASAGQIYFGTSTSETEDPCEGYSETSDNGKGKIYALKADDGTVSFSEQVGDIISPPVVVDEHLYFKTSDKSKVKSYGKGSYNNKPISKSITRPASVKSWKEITNDDEFNKIPDQWKEKSCAP